MKLRMSTVWMSVCLLVISLPALSADQAFFRLLGFSVDGVYAAWKTGGVQDGSGFQWIEVEILNTKSSLPEEGFRHVWSEYMDELPEAADIVSVGERIEDIYCAYGIDLGNTGNLLVYHPVTDLGVKGDTVVFCLVSYSPSYNSSEIILTLSTLPVDMEQSYPDWFPSPVTPVLHVTEGGEEHLFFSEEEIPEPYRMNFDYSIAAVYSNPADDNSLLVVLHSTRPGFEGSDGRFRVVSGSI
ncbi:MAG: DUF2259 domain-containing protein [Candidatus Sabulitectum sp.]|nr:DUF2259 domain-containing protein [Candidatus Sabulitectum sp.]